MAALVDKITGDGHTPCTSETVQLAGCPKYDSATLGSADGVTIDVDTPVVAHAKIALAGTHPYA